MRRSWKRVICSFIIFALLMTVPFIDGFGLMTRPTVVLAEKSLKDQKKDAENKLQDAKDKLDGLKDDQSSVESDLTKKAAELENLVAAQRKLSGDIDAKQEAIEQNQIELAEAMAEREAQYEAMKLRIQFMYENSSNDNMWAAILEADGFTDMLNRIEYVSDVYNSDRDLMTAYQEAVDRVEEVGAQLESELEEMVALKSQYETQQSQVESAISALEAKKDQFSSQIAAAKGLTEEYQAKVNELARKIQEEEARAAGAGSNYGGGGTGSGGISAAASGDQNPAAKTNISGDEVIAYAMQFVGNDYVWGGTSLTNGCDCSGFVVSVYAHFGVFSDAQAKSHAFSSATLRNVGSAVGYNHMQAGDIVCYPGHVALYIGNGKIVEAQSTKAGITSGRSVQCHTILAIRRVI